MNEQVQAELKKMLNGRFSTSESARANYARGEDTYDPVLSQAVVFPETNEEVSKILKRSIFPFASGKLTTTENFEVGSVLNGASTNLDFNVL